MKTNKSIEQPAVPSAPHSLWILVADGKQAQMYAQEKVAHVIALTGNATRGPSRVMAIREPVLIQGMKWKAEKPEQYKIGRNATGMVFESSGSARHMAEPHADARTEVKQHFALALAEQLNAAKTKERFEQLVLIAPPKMLNEIKKHLSKGTLKSVIAELAKELTHCNAYELSGHLQGVLKPSV